MYLRCPYPAVFIGKRVKSTVHIYFVIHNDKTGLPDSPCDVNSLEIYYRNRISSPILSVPLFIRAVRILGSCKEYIIAQTVFVNRSRVSEIIISFIVEYIRITYRLQICSPGGRSKNNFFIAPGLAAIFRMSVCQPVILFLTVSGRSKPGINASVFILYQRCSVSVIRSSASP